MHGSLHGCRDGLLRSRNLPPGILPAEQHDVDLSNRHFPERATMTFKPHVLRTLSLTTSVALASTFFSGCVSTRDEMRAARTIDPSFQSWPVLAANTTIERDYALRQENGEADRHAKREKRIYRAGLATGAVGSALALGFGVLSALTNKQLDDGLDNGLSRDRYNDLKDRGNMSNHVTWISAAIGFVGWASAAIVYGESFRSCGALAPKRRKCEEVAAGATAAD
jgi:hypothetical protein